MIDSPVALLVYVILGIVLGRLVDAAVAYLQTKCGNRYLCLLAALAPIVGLPLLLQTLGHAGFVAEWTMDLSGLFFVIFFFAMQRHVMAIVSNFSLT